MRDEVMGRASALLDEALAQVREERSLSGEPMHGLSHEAALRAIAKALSREEEIRAEERERCARIAEANSPIGIYAKSHLVSDACAIIAEQIRDGAPADDGWMPMEMLDFDPTPDNPVLIWHPSFGITIATQRYGQYGVGSARYWRPLPAPPVSSARGG